MTNRCLYCYKIMSDSNEHYHSACCKKIFESNQPPILDISHAEIEQLAKQTIKAQQSVTGVQNKLSLHIDNTTSPKRLTIVGLWGEYILKPQSTSYQSLPEVEDLTMHLAKLTGIATVPHTLIYLRSGELAYLTKRLDRHNAQKIAMEDMCQLTGRLTEDKYHSSYEQIAKTILHYSANPVLDLINFYEQVIFSFLVGNSDMHLKNFSLIEGAQGFTLMPAYDLLSTQLVNPADDEDLALALNGKKKRLKRIDFDQAMASNKQLTTKQIDVTLNKFQRYLPKWIHFVEQSFLSKTLQEQYIKLIKQRVSRLNK